MFEGQVAYYLNRYLGCYLEGIDPASLRISVFRVGDPTAGPWRGRGGCVNWRTGRLGLGRTWQGRTCRLCLRQCAPLGQQVCALQRLAPAAARCRRWGSPGHAPARGHRLLALGAMAELAAGRPNGGGVVFTELLATHPPACLPPSSLGVPCCLFRHALP